MKTDAPPHSKIPSIFDHTVLDSSTIKSNYHEVRETARMMRWWDLLLVGQETFYGRQPLNSTFPAQDLQAKRDRLAQVLADYEKAKRNQL